jgi:uncharacterized membrane protein YhaH (DUF805 family)
MLAILRYNLRRLASFEGRQPGRSFWPYAGFVIGLVFVSMFVLMLPEMLDTFSRVQRFAAEHPDQARVEVGPGRYSIQIKGDHPELLPDMRVFGVGVGVLTILAVLLLAAAVARRLHDRNLSGFWGLMPLPFLLFGLVAMPRAFDAARRGVPRIDTFLLIFFNNLIYLALLGLLVFLLARRGTPGPNRYGPAPEPDPR